MAVVELVGDFRRRTGKGGSRQVRRDGFIPAVLYGKEEEPLSIKIDAGAFRKLMRTPGGHHSLIDFKLPEQGEIQALIREIQRDPVSREIVHIDFNRVRAGVAVDIVVPISLTGVSYGVKTEGGIMEHVTRELSVRCLPRHMPGTMELDVSELKIGDRITVADLSIPDAEILTEVERTIVLVAAPNVIEEPTTGEEAEEGAEGAVAAAGDPAAADGDGGESKGD
jgi:large subunit ribosomal protein L25